MKKDVILDKCLFCKEDLDFSESKFAQNRHYCSKIVRNSKHAIIYHFSIDYYSSVYIAYNNFDFRYYYEIKNKEYIIYAMTTNIEDDGKEADADQLKNFEYVSDFLDNILLFE